MAKGEARPGEEEDVSLVSGLRSGKQAPVGFGVGGLSSAEFFAQKGDKGGFHSLQVDGTDAKGPHKERNCPEEEANWFSRWLFLYVDGLIKAGAKQALNQDDLWDMSRRDEAQRVYSIFNTKLRGTVLPDKPQGLVWKAVWRTHGTLFVWSGVLKMVHDIIMFMPPYVLGRLLHHMADGGDRRTTFMWACVMLLVAVAENITVNIYFHILYRISLHCKIEMIQMLYEKSLRVTSAVKAEMGVGAIVNLQSNDASKIWNTPLYLHIVWNGPFQILIVMGMLVRIMHWGPALAAFVVTVIMIPASTLVGKALGKVRRAMVKQTDARVKLATEIITGIKAIKLYAWEDAYMDRVSALREQELRHIKRTQLLSTLNMSLFSAGPVFVALAAFSVYSLMGYHLTAAVAFPALSLFNLLRFPIIMFPSQVMNMIHARVGLQRIQKFMEKDEMKPRGSPDTTTPTDNPFSTAVQVDDDAAPLLASSGHVAKPSHDPSHALPPILIGNGHMGNGNGHMANGNGHMSNGHGHLGKGGLRSVRMCIDDIDEDDEVIEDDVVVEDEEVIAIRVKNGTFSWEAKKEASLRDLSLTVEAGTLVMVVGQVGSGKSSLLSALLGEMHRVGGKVEVVGSVAYTAQDPWIQNSTLRNNVLMGKPYDEEHYTSVLAASALAADLEMLPAGDATEIGEKGVNLSGGQKHRVALARAAYADADVYLLDDPLSAVDAHVGRTLFDECICGLLDGTTRVLVTHQLQYLPSADLVVVMADGQIRDIGGYEELLDRGVDLNQFVKKSGTTESGAAEGGTEGAGGKQGSEGGGAKGAGKVGLSRFAVQPNSLDDSPRANKHRPPAAFDDSNSDIMRRVQLVSASMIGPPPQLGMSNSIMSVPSVAPLTTTDSAVLPTSGGGGAGKARNQQLQMASSGVHGAAPYLEETSSVLQRRLALPFSVSVIGAPPDLGRGYGHYSERRERAVLRRTESKNNLSESRQSLRRMLTLKEQDGKIIKVEERAVGQVDKAVYRAYIAAWSSAFVLLPIAVMLMATCERGLQVGQNYVLSFWTNDTAEAAKEGRGPHTKRWLTIYFMLGMISIGFQMMRAVSTVAGSISASRSLHKALMEKVVRLPMSFYDSQPTGRLLNRMTKDTESVDVQVSSSVMMALTWMVNAILSIIVVSVVTPIALAALLPLGFLYYRVQSMYIASSRELKRLDALAFSPIFQHFSESLHGLPTIRAFDKQPMFITRNQNNLDNSNRAYWPIQVVNRWLSVRLEMMGAFIVFVTAVSVAVVRPSSPGLVGLAITSALNLTGIMNWVVRQMTELEVNMNSVERLVEYLKYDEEAPAVIESRRPPPGWPHAGAIEARSLTVRYRPELDPVLKDISFKVYAREKIGVCGRTGCGKSTLMITLYRLIEPCGGSILIDDLDITSIGLRDLRSRLSLVPQDPVIFSGTIRSNLDPFNAVSADADVWEALRRAGMDEYVRGQEGGLSAPIKEGGANLSVGQRQLLCMARALLRASRILVLDEATSNVDHGTDGLIQTTIRSAFSDCTVLTIAHRLHTIIDSDRVLLLDAGNLEEFDTPHNLLQLPDSAFRKLVEETTKGGGLSADSVADALATAISAANHN